MTLECSKATDSTHKVKLESNLVDASWLGAVAYAGQKAAFRIQTAFVGSGAPITVVGKSEKGKKLGKIKGKINGNAYVGAFDIPDDMDLSDSVYFEVKLSKHGLEGESDLIPVRPKIMVTNMKWSASEARRGDTLTLSAKVTGLRDNAEVAIVIYEYDRDAIHDRIAELPAVAVDGRVEIQWEYQYHEDTGEIPTEQELQKYGRNYNPPEYFFTIKVEGAELGRDQESGLLVFKEWIEIQMIDEDGAAVAGQDYVLHFADGQEQKGQLDRNGRAKIYNAPPGPVLLKFPADDDSQGSDPNQPGG